MLTLIGDSNYRESLETVAPGIAVLLKSAATSTENWFDTLLRVLPSINCTAEQTQLLTDAANRASTGLDPVGYITPPVNNIAPLISPEKFLTYCGVAAILFKLIK